jgi:N-acetylglutamate synthase-like GNAT family acetyltransferase
MIVRIERVAMGDVLIRQATDHDNAAAELVAQRAFDELRSIYRPKHGISSSSDSPMCRLVAESCDRIVGTVRYEIESEQLRLRGLAVELAWRHRGIARALIERLDVLAKTLRVKLLSLYTIKQTGNVPTFERLGFQTVREEPAAWAISDCFAELTEVLMEKSV